MSTLDYIPPANDLLFLPHPPPVEAHKDHDWILEIGPGKGELFFHLVKTHPEKKFVAVEIKNGRFYKIGQKIQTLEIDNASIIRGDARECLTRLFPPNFFKKIYILFPDPWPKKKHAKHRLLKPRLIAELWKLLQTQGEIISATDAGFYAEQIVESFQEAGGFAMKNIDSPYPTYFEQKWKRLGREIAYFSFAKVEEELKILAR